jgi:hypothetical protein
VLLEPYPEKWNDLVGSRGECFACGSVQKVPLTAPFSSHHVAALDCLFVCSGLVQFGNRYHRHHQIKTKFIEAGTREPIWVFNGRDERVLAQQILKFIVRSLALGRDHGHSALLTQHAFDHLQRSAPPSHTSYEAGSRVHFERVLRPANFRGSTREASHVLATAY